MKTGELPSTLVIGFNRAKLLSRVFDGLRNQPVGRIYLWLDGARSENENDRIELDNIMSQIPKWDSEFDMMTNFSLENLGCKTSVVGALDWFFSHEEEGVILEDDCLPSPGFLKFMHQQLHRWRDDERVLTISGNSIFSAWDSSESYHFSKYPHIWGWGTWRSVWESYDPNIEKWRHLRRTDWLTREVGLSREAARFWRYKFNSVLNHKVDTWDYQLTFLSFLNSGMNVIPHENLVRNVGFGDDATHTKHRPEHLVRDFTELGAIVHPQTIQINQYFDRRVELYSHRTKRSFRELLAIFLRRLRFHRPHQGKI